MIKQMKTCIVTGSCGLVGSESVRFFISKGYRVIGIDNDMRNYFFNTTTNHIRDELVNIFGTQYTHSSIDIRNLSNLESIFSDNIGIELIIHCAAQPSHDWAAKEPLTDFGVNALGTCNLLELTRKHCPTASFIYMSTNKVYGDTPNHLKLQELENRYEGPDVDETMSVDQCKHSLFGVSKLAGDLMVQEYGRYFGMNTVVFRGGCITGPNHQGAQLHGFLSYLVKCIMHNEPYTIFGYKGKQVRDNIHAFDLVNAFWNYHQNPHPGMVYNIGGGRSNASSILETISLINELTGKQWNKYTYSPENRIGDHIFYITNLNKFKKDYPTWSITYSLNRILIEIIASQSTTTITSQLTGGVGNQLFQIATAYSISRKLNAKLKLDFQGWEARQGSHPSKYTSSLYQKLKFDLFNDINVKTFAESSFMYSPIIDDIASLINCAPLTLRLHGCWQSERYFREYRDEIRQLFTPNEGVISFLDKHTSLFQAYPELKTPNDFCFIGVRRGDYITYSDFHKPCGMTYYNKAIQEISASKYYILSDDIPWCKLNFIGDNYVFLELNDDTTQLFASMLFKKYIISNSSFYWWGSYLSIYDDTVIYAPDKWVHVEHSSIYRDEMRIIERPVETI